MRNICIGTVILFFVMFGLPKFTGVISSPAQEPFDRYKSLIAWDLERVNLDNFGIYLKKNPTMVGYIVYYVGEKDSLDVVKKRINKSRQYLIKTRQIDKNQFRIICGGKGADFSITILHLLDASLPPPVVGIKTGCKKPIVPT